ncbi:MAG: hypothetical protein N4A47_04975 [Clostridia bacterium]|jgi:hypothetical protein|nr:hypothetical protein [Clostridia bacterium]
MKKYAFYLIVIYIFLRLFNINNFEDLNKTLSRAWDERDNFIELVTEAFSEVEEDYDNIYNDDLKYISASEKIKKDVENNRDMFLTVRISKDEEAYIFSDVNFSLKINSTSLKDAGLNMFRKIEDTKAEDIEDLKIIGGSNIYSLDDLIDIVDEENYKGNLYLYLADSKGEAADAILNEVKDLKVTILVDNKKDYDKVEFDNKGLYIKDDIKLDENIEFAIVREEYIKSNHKNINRLFAIKTALNEKFKVNEINSLDKKYKTNGFVVSNIEDILK